MHKINTDTATSEGEFTDGDESQAIPPTDLNAAWFNSVQRELLNVLSGMGVNPDAAADNQIWGILQKIGFRCVLVDNGALDVSGFSGATAIFCTAANLTITGGLSNNSLILIVPLWTNSVGDSIAVSYGGENLVIDKWQMFVGFAANGDVQLSGVFVPMFGGDRSAPLRVANLTAGQVNATTVKSVNRFDEGIVMFENRFDEGVDLQEWQTWQLASNWQVKQVKRVICTNAAAGGTAILTFGTTSGGQSSVKFYPASYREFMCIGTYEVGDVTFAVLAVNGKAS